MRLTVGATSCEEWGGRALFELDITRQVIFGDGEDDDIFQLSLTFQFAGTDEHAAWKGTHWCKSRAALADFRALARTAAPLVALGDARAQRVMLRFGGV